MQEPSEVVPTAPGQHKDDSHAMIVFEETTPLPLTFKKTKTVGFVLNDYSKAHLVLDIWVENLAFKKQVFVRYTEDEWKSYQDVHATYADVSSPEASTHDLFKVSAATLLDSIVQLYTQT
eukprot:m.34030 g.34030  ORF g.34030 m.34030 type:complete len:120 (-) comp10962_c0_seq1:98-457(-)